MCGIVGLHLRNPELYPQLGQLVTGMLCEMAERGSDSTGVAVYGDPTWSPPGHGCVSLLEVDASPDEVAAALDVSVKQLDATYLLTAQASSERHPRRRRSAYPDALVAGFGADLAVLKGVGHPRMLTDAGAWPRCRAGRASPTPGWRPSRR